VWSKLRVMDSISSAPARLDVTNAEAVKKLHANVDRILQTSKREILSCFEEFTTHNTTKNEDGVQAGGHLSVIPAPAIPHLAIEAVPGQVQDSEPPAHREGGEPGPERQVSARSNHPLAGIIPEKKQGATDVDADAPQRMSSRQRRHMRWKNAGRNSTFMSQSRLSEIMSQASWAERIVRSKCFETFSGCLILFNCVFIGWHTQAQANDALNRVALSMDPAVKTSAEVLVLQMLFTLCFMVELLVRWAAEGFLDFWKTSDLVWNLLDLTCVVIGFVDLTAETVLLATGSDDKTPLRGFTVIRVLRVVRIVRVVRVIRIMRFFRDLRMMIFSTVNSLKSVVWIILFLFVLFYMFGIAFTSAIVSQLDTLEARNATENIALQQYFGTLDKSILTLYMAMSGGQNWGVYYETLAMMSGGEFWCVLYILYITFSIFAVVNIVTGVFVDTALQSSKNDREVVVQEELDQKQDYLSQLRELFQAIDENSSGRITREVLEQAFKHETILAFFTSLKIDVPDATTLFDLLDFDQSGSIDLEEFLHGCYHLHGEASNLEAKMMQAEVRFMKENLLNLVEDMHNMRSQMMFLKRN